MKPFIGIITDIDNDYTSHLAHDYVKAVELSGGTPILIPYIKSIDNLNTLISLCNGFIFTGGGDVNPKFYNQEKSKLCGSPQIARDEFEIKFFNHIKNSFKPILCICRGMQLLNVILGGDLYQDIPSEFNTQILHKQPQGKYETSHEVKVSPDTPLCKIINNNRIVVNSFHHQAIKNLATDLKPMAISDDGIIEAVYAINHPYLMGYQWHPERLIDTEASSKFIFSDFIIKCIS